jgi:hypothetical protein
VSWTSSKPVSRYGTSASTSLAARQRLILQN